MVHPYAKYSADKVGKGRAKKYQTGGEVVTSALGGLGAGALAGLRKKESVMEYNKTLPRAMTPSEEVDAAVVRQKESDRKSRTGGY